jgi:5-methylcytosine-specific restriction enzyme A
LFGEWITLPEAPKRFDPLQAARAAGLIKRTPRQESDERRGNASERGYDGRWAKYSRGRRKHAEHALCCCCQANGHIRASSLTDHIIPARRRPDLFWHKPNHQDLCDWCHNTIKKTLEARYDAGEIDERDLNLARPLPDFFAPP